ncbi:hypothetical protein CSUI_007127 [Cystoisospora suis]|uniref:Uncharacterized protein n=1 Tax=Cystoisospora suis TaxID=483139 RepID=A0A2C6KRM7_9APIC|nr:hypothetical protein CSUI_007127 [Cystoisospora suis]
MLTHVPLSSAGLRWEGGRCLSSFASPSSSPKSCKSGAPGLVAVVHLSPQVIGKPVQSLQYAVEFEHQF